MDIKELFKGVAVVIDDKINDTESGDLILKIVDTLRKEKIPLLEYEYLPPNEIVSNFQNVSFVLLDWQLFEKPEPEISIDEDIHISQVINFLKNLNEKYFLPVFIFSKENSDAIIRKLNENGLYEEGKSNYIFVKAKAELISEDNNKIFTEIENWLKKTPSIYVLKEWENSLNQAKNKLFWDFYNINHKWPSVLQKTFTDDGSDVNYELGNFIFKNIMARTEPINFDEEILRISDDDLTKDELRKVLEAERFIRNGSLPPETPFAGDLYKLYKYELSKNATSEKELYYLNIRPDCDIVRGDNPILYCLECEVIDDNKVENVFDKGSLISKVSNSYIPFIDNGKVLIVRFKELHTFEWQHQLYDKEGKEHREFNKARVGRILPPYITAIQQKYSFYLQRQGLPAIPEKAIK